jgi:hypothetical protein
VLSLSKHGVIARQSPFDGLRAGLEQVLKSRSALDIDQPSAELVEARRNNAPIAVRQAQGGAVDALDAATHDSRT